MRVLPLILAFGLCVVQVVEGHDTAAPAPLQTNIAECLGNLRGRTNPLVPLRLEAVVTLVEPERSLIVVQDDSGAMGVNLSLTHLNLKPGQRISLEGNGVLPYVRSFPDYPDRPTGRGFLQSFEVPTNLGNYYLARIRGYLHPPATGRYLFWIAADDAGEFWLSPDADPGKMQKTAALTVGNATTEREWNRYASQGSQSVELKAGEKYYVEALHIQGAGRDSLAVAWEGPGIKQSVIDGGYLTPWEGPAANVVAPTNGLLREYWTNFLVRDFQALYGRSRRESVVRIPDLKVTVLGEGKFPQPQPITSAASLDAVPNYHWTEFTGGVTFAGGMEDKLKLELTNGTMDLEARVLGWGAQSTARLKNSQIRVQGILIHAYGPAGEITNNVLWVPQGDQVTLEVPMESSEVESRRVLISEIEPANPRMTWGRRVQVRGHVAGRAADGTVVFQGDDKYQGYVSVDGTNWVAMGKPMEIGMSNSVLVGLALASHHPEDLATAKYDHLQGWGTNWLAAYINSSAERGGFTVDGPTVTLLGSGRNIWRSADQNYYVYQALEGEGEFSVRLADLKQSDVNTQTGVMIRESLDRGSPDAALLFCPATSMRLQCRRIFGEYPVVFLAPRPGNPEYRWMKVTRKRNRVLVQADAGLELETNRPVDVTGTITWRNGSPILTETSFQVAPTNAPQVFSFRREVGRSISIETYLAEAQKSSLPYLRGSLEVVDLRGIVTFCDRVFDRSIMFMQEGATGIPVAWTDAGAMPVFQVGQLVEADGRSVVGQFPVTLNPSRIRVTGWGMMPRPLRYSSELVASGNGHGNWVEAEGVIRSQGTNGVMNLMAKDGPLAVWIGRAGTNWQKYINALVRVRGVLSLEAERDALLLVPSPEFVELEEPPPPDPFAIPAFPIADLAGLNVKPEQLRQIKVAGVVTCVLKKSLYLQDETGGVYVQLSQTPSVQPGDSVEVVGFPNGRSSVVLTDAAIRKTGTRPLPVPLPIAAEENGGQKFEAVLVRTEAILIEQQNGLEGQVLILQADAGIIRAVLADPGAGRGRLPNNLQAGSRIAVTGVCNFQAGDELGEAEESGDQPLAVAFRIWLRTPADVVLLQRPPWWTWKQAVTVLGVFAFGLLVTVLWIRMLRRRVAQRTRELQEAMNQLQKETHTSAVLAERNRLAGEIHDGLEQGLTAIMLQLDAVGKVWHKPEEARRFLGMARNMAGFSRTDVKLAVWDLQSPLLENADLGLALTRLASEVGIGGTQPVTVEINGESRPLPTAMEHHLLRIGQEAITNALKHARPQTIHVTLDYQENGLQLSIKDDGCGFVPDKMLNVARDGHFGLQGIRARALKVNAEVKIISEPGQGTTIVVNVPLDGNGSTGL